MSSASGVGDAVVCLLADEFSVLAARTVGQELPGPQRYSAAPT